MSIVIKVDKKQLHEMKEYYLNEIDFDSTIPYTYFVVSKKDLKIYAYNSQKVMFQGSLGEQEAKRWQAKPFDQNVSIKIKPQASIGMDECGTGDFFGPVVVCSCFIDDEIIKKINHLNIMDSKLLDDQKIINIASKLKNVVPHTIIVLNNDKYNEVWSSKNNMNAIKAKLHNHALVKLLNKLDHQPELIILDQFCSPDLYFKYLSDIPTVVRNIHFETKAESKYLAVAIASILGRYAFIQAMDELGDQFDVVLQKGAGPLVDAQGASLVDKHGEAILTKISKLNFSNVSKIKNLVKKH